MARLYREALETVSLAIEPRTEMSGAADGNVPFFQLPAPPVPTKQPLGQPDALKPQAIKSRMPRRPAKSGHRR